MAQKRKSRRIRTREGRVLRVDGHSRRKASKLMRARRYARRHRLHVPARSGNLSYQSAAWLLANGPKRGKRKRTRRAAGRPATRHRAVSRRPTARKAGGAQPDFFQFMADQFGGSQARRNPARRSQGDQRTASELVLYAENDGDLYRQQRHPIELNLRRKIAKGTYRGDLSEKLWFYFATNAAKKYLREFGSPPYDLVAVFTAETRRMAAHQMRLNFESEAKAEGLLGRRNPTKAPMKRWHIFWSPEGRIIATVVAEDARSAKKKTPLPYRKYMGEVYVEEAMTEGPFGRRSNPRKRRASGSGTRRKR